MLQSYCRQSLFNLIIDAGFIWGQYKVFYINIEGELNRISLILALDNECFESGFTSNDSFLYCGDREEYCHCC
jgi:hypothetical protein